MKLEKFFKPAEKQIYIVPNGWGFFYFFGTILVFITAFVFGNSSLYLFGFALTTFFITAMLQTNNNLRGLSVHYARLDSCHAGQDVTCLVLVKNDSNVERTQLRLKIMADQDKKNALTIDECAARQSLIAKSRFRSLKRGVFTAPRIQISSQYPVGLFFSWKLHRTVLCHTVFPKPAGELPLPESHFENGMVDQSTENVRGNEDFSGLHLYTGADAPGRIAWNVLARGLPLSAKSFEVGTHSARILNYENILIANHEVRLSQLAAWILMCEQRGESYQLLLPWGVAEQGVGPEFALLCLSALANAPLQELPVATAMQSAEIHSPLGQARVSL